MAHQDQGRKSSGSHAHDLLPERGERLTALLDRAIIDPCKRKNKTSRDYPRKKQQTATGPPVLRNATRSQIIIAQQVKAEQRKGLTAQGGTRRGSRCSASLTLRVTVWGAVGRVENNRHAQHCWASQQWHPTRRSPSLMLRVTIWGAARVCRWPLGTARCRFENLSYPV